MYRCPVSIFRKSKMKPRWRSWNPKTRVLRHRGFVSLFRKIETWHRYIWKSQLHVATSVFQPRNGSNWELETICHRGFFQKLCKKKRFAHDIFFTSMHSSFFHFFGSSTGANFHKCIDIAFPVIEGRKKLNQDRIFTLDDKTPDFRSWPKRRNQKCHLERPFLSFFGSMVVFQSSR